MAKQDQQVLMGQKSQLEKDLSNARITDFSEASVDQVAVGCITTLKVTSTGQTLTYKVMGAWDSDPDNFIIAYKTPLGQALLGRRVGETVDVKIGQKEDSYKILSLSRVIDA
jgi:transcription elongation GreA/GreB family factor